MARKRTDLPFGQAVSRLMEERGIGLRELARALDISAPYLSRLINQRDRPSRSASPELLDRTARYFELPPEYFPEVRENAVVEAITTDSKWRDRLYAQLQSRAANTDA